jgi:hypothetical protein
VSRGLPLILVPLGRSACRSTAGERRLAVAVVGLRATAPTDIFGRLAPVVPLGGAAMPLHIIKGHYRIQGSEPDGDSLHFHPADPNAFTSLHLVAHSTALLHLARRCHRRIAKWSRFSSGRLPEVLKAINPGHRRWRSGPLVEDAGVSDRQMQQCPHAGDRRAGHLGAPHPLEAQPLQGQEAGAAATTVVWWCWQVTLTSLPSAGRKLPQLAALRANDGSVGRH